MNLTDFLASYDAPFLACIGTVMLFAGSSYFWGRSLNLLLKIRFRLKTAGDILLFLCGLNISGLIALAFGLCPAVSKFEIWILLTAFSGSAGFIFLLAGRKVFSRIKLIPSALILSFILLVLGTALSYPIGWDELTYHIALPLRWIADRAVILYMDNPYSGFPASPEMIFQILISGGGIKTPRLFTLFLYAVSGLSIYILLKPQLKKWQAAILWAAFMFSPIILMIARETYVEVFILAYIAAALLFRKYAVTKNVWQTAFIAGILGAGACSIKLSAISAAAAIFIISAPSLREKFRFIVFTAIFITTLLLLAGPFYLRPYLAAGNPFYPYMAEFFGTSQNQAALEVSNYQHAAGSVKFGMDNITGFIIAPFLMTFETNVFDGASGLQFLILSVLALLYFYRNPQWKNPFILRLAAAAILMYVFWFQSSQQARFLLPFFLLLLLIARAGILIFKQKSRKTLLILILVLSICSIETRALKHYINSWNNALGPGNILNYIYAGTGAGYLQAVDYLLHAGKKGEKVLMVFENRGLYMPLRAEHGTPFFQSKYFTASLISGTLNEAEIESELRSNGITYILAGLSNNDPDRINSYMEKSLPLAKSIQSMEEKGILEKLFDHENFIIYRLNQKK